MRPCEEYAALLDAYVDGELDAAGMDRVRSHLEDCPGCRAYVDDALAIRAAFPDVEDTEVPAGFAEAVSAAIRAGAAPQRKRHASWTKVLAPLAACCAIVLLLANLPGVGGDTLRATGEGASRNAAATEDEAASAPPEEAGGAAAEDTGEADAAAEDPAPSLYMAQQEPPETEGASGGAAGERSTAVRPAEAAVPEDAEAEDQLQPTVNAALVDPEEPEAGSQKGTDGSAALNALPADPETEDAGWFATLTVAPEQADAALDALPPEVPVSSDPDTGGTVYWLTAEQFADLLEQLGDPAYEAGGQGSMARVILLPA